MSMPIYTAQFNSLHTPTCSFRLVKMTKKKEMREGDWENGCGKATGKRDPGRGLGKGMREGDWEKGCREGSGMMMSVGVKTNVISAVAKKTRLLLCGLCLATCSIGLT